MRIDLFENTKSRYEVLSYMTKGLHNALRRLGIRSTCLDIAGCSREKIREALRRGKADYTLGLNVLVDRDFLPMCTHIAIFVDHMAWHQNALSCPEMVAAFVDKSSSELFTLCGHARTLFLPHAVDQEWCRQKLPSAARDFDIVMAGSFIDGDEIMKKWKRQFSKKLYTLCRDVAEEALTSPQNHMAILLYALRAQPDLLAEIGKKKIPLYGLVTSLDLVIRSFDKIRLLNALEGYKIDLFGLKEEHAKWKRVLRGNITYHEALPFEELIEIFSRSKIVVNSLATIKYGIHERALYALAAGSSVITNENPFISLYFPPSRAMLFWDAKKPDTLAERVKRALSSEAVRLGDIRRARRIIAQHHTWDVRLRELLRALSAL